MWPWSGRNFSNHILKAALRHKNAYQNRDTIIRIVKYGEMYYHFYFIDSTLYFKTLYTYVQHNILPLFMIFYILWNKSLFRNFLYLQIFNFHTYKSSIFIIPILKIDLFQLLLKIIFSIIFLNIFFKFKLISLI